MKLPYLLLRKMDLTETLAETARRRATALREQVKRARFEEALRAELIAMQDLRQVMATREPK
jgi:hypothetical protein